jgi:hypothetical protein
VAVCVKCALRQSKFTSNMDTKTRTSEIVSESDEDFLRRDKFLAGCQQTERIAEACIYTIFIEQIRRTETQI